MNADSENIDEVLNSFIDGELTARQEIEVQRLIANDEALARRLRQLAKCKMLMGSLPSAEAPAGMLEEIKASLARRTLLNQQPVAVDERAGARELFLRKVFAAAAMIGLAAVLGAVVYSIVAPQSVSESPGTWAKPDRRYIEPVPAVAAMQFNGRLELTTAAFSQVDPAVHRAIEDNELVECIALDRQGDRTTYVLACGREGLDLLLGNLESTWGRFDSARFVVQTGTFGETVGVDGVTAEQIAGIVGQRNIESDVQLARDFALLNGVTEYLRSGSVVARDEAGADWRFIPKPRLTGPRRPVDKAANGQEDKTKVNLVVVVISSRSSPVPKD